MDSKLDVKVCERMQTFLAHIKKNQNKIVEWLDSHEKISELPLYSSVDIRDAGFKVCVVDTNLFPAGFNNLCEHGLADAVGLFKKAIGRRVPNCRKILIIAEEHTRNTWYLENVRILEETIHCWEKEGTVKYLGETMDVRPFIAQSDAAVYPSFYREGVPRFLLEAMSMGRPIITTSAVGCREVVEDGMNGFMVRPKDTPSLINAMMRMVELPLKDRIAMGKHGRKKAVLEFDEKKVIETYLNAIIT